MCSQFTQKVDRSKLIETLKIAKEYGIFTKEKILPHQPALIVRSSDEGLITENMNFSLIPAWSKTPRVKFATHNARLETVDEKPSFREAFRKRHCVVPMNAFIEPIYFHELAGNMIAFSSEEILFAAGIWETWSEPQGGEVTESFTILTTPPLPFVEKIGHDRSPVFLRSDNVKPWLQSEGQPAASLKSFLQQNLFAPPLHTVIDRAMAKGWEKRIPK